MRTIVNPQQTQMFDSFDGVLSPKARQRLLDSWPGVFRHVLLERMPADALARHFAPAMGRPSKEWYSMAGLIFLAEYFNWTREETLNAYCFHLDVHYALNREPVAQDLSIRTLERNIARFKEDELAEAVLADVTVRLVELLGLQIDRQRLDSTHIFSDMARFGRTRLPEQMLVDTLYASDENVQLAQAQGVELVGPTPSGAVASKNIDPLNIDDFDVDETTEEVICCPAGHTPQSSVHDQQTGKTKTGMPNSACSQCDFAAECPVKKSGDGYILEHTAKQRRLAGRRREENTEAFRERYRVRGGIEGTNSSLKRATGLGQLRVRGRPAVFHAIYLKIAGWNMRRATACAKLRKIVYERAHRAVPGRIYAILRLPRAIRSVRIALKTQITAYVRQYGGLPPLPIAA